MLAAEQTKPHRPLDSLVSVRKFPYPYRAMLAICSDIDRTNIETFRALHRFLNTREETEMGEGLGLDVADSMWVLKARGHTSDLSLLEDHLSHVPESYADELTSYAHAGWIDTLHSYGNFSSDPVVVFERRHAEIAIAELLRRDIRLPVWVNHGSATNIQNFGKGTPQQGDIPMSPGYHTDLLLEYGVRFCWDHTGGPRAGRQELLRPMSLRDGRRVWGFPRYTSALGERAQRAFERHAEFYARNRQQRATLDERPATMLWWPPLLDSQLSGPVLDALVDDGCFCVVGQHLGALDGASGMPPAAVEVFRSLSRRQHRGEILIARTSRLLEYERVARHIRFELRGSPEQLYVDITHVEDPVMGTFVPTIAQLRGVTFHVPDPAKTHLLLNGKPIPGRELERWPSDGVAPSIGLTWFKPDHTDHAEPFRAEPATGSVGHSTTAGDPAGPSIWVLEVLARAGPQSDSVTDGYANAVEHASRKYSDGLEWYEGTLERLGFANRDRALDVGSATGHWSVALAEHNRAVVALEPDHDQAEVASRMAAYYRAGERVTLVVGVVEDAGFAEAEFELIWAHDVLMFTDHDVSFPKLAGWAADDALFYCGYRAVGTHAQNVIRGLLGGNGPLLQSGLDALLLDAERRAGLGGDHRVATASRGELLEICAALDFEYLSSPGVQAGPGSFHGVPLSFDFVCRRRRRRRAAALPGSYESLRDRPFGRIRRLVEVGLPSLAIQSLTAEQKLDARGAELFLRAHLRRGEPIVHQSELLSRIPMPTQPLLIAMSDQLAGSWEQALKGYAEAAHDPSAAVLSALCLLKLGRYDEALEIADEEIVGAGQALSQLAIKTSALLHGYGPTAARLPAIDWLTRQRDRGDTDPSEANETIRRLS